MRKPSILKTFALLFPILVFLSIFSLTVAQPTFTRSNKNSTSVKKDKLVGQVLPETCTPITCPSGQTWDDNSCSCMACEPYPCGGAMYFDMNECVCMCPSYPTCTEDEYWDPWDCLCKPTGGTGCTEPTDGCPTGTYWDTAYCSCVTSSTCQEPSAGCGDHYYWDTGLCKCRCISNYTCPTNYYWDTASCTCLPTGSTNTCDPQYCGVNHYWDESSCSCKCASYVACPMYQYWDVSTCSCLSTTTTSSSGGGDNTTTTTTTTTNTTTCSPPNAGCSVNYYWDYATCSCRPDESYTIGGTDCYPPKDGCNTGNYWDYDTCSCKYDSSLITTTCTKPSAGCGTGYYWDYGSCSCVYAQTSLDRLAYEPNEIIYCIRSKLSDSEYQKLRYFIPTTQEGRDTIQNIKNKVASCWTITSDQGSTMQTTSTPFDKEQCLINSIGNMAYREIYEGRRTPTQNEYLWFQKCFGSVQKNVISLLSVNDKLPEDTVNCLKKKLGNDLYQKVYSGQTEMPQNLRKSVETCFGAKQQPFEQGTSYQAPQVVKDCLYKTVGEVKYNEIISGKTQPTQEEKEKVKQCFTNLNQEQQKFLPPPPEQVPFFEEDEAIKFEKVDQEKRKVKKMTYGGKLTLSGKAQPNATVMIYIYSDPIVVTTKTDENGDWVYEMQKPLNEGKHVAYALVKSEKGGYVRSSVINFDVLASEEEPTPVFIDEQEASEVQKRFIYYSAGVIILITLITTGTIYFFYTRKKMKEIEESEGSSTNGNSETKS